jgi:hypothetical protein
VHDNKIGLVLYSLTPTPASELHNAAAPRRGALALYVYGSDKK